MDDPKRGQNVTILKQAQRFFVCVAVATGIFWLYKGPAKDAAEWHFRLALSGGAFIGAIITTVLIIRKRSEK